jgi:putrescine transport system substrate-binding protein
MKTTSACLIVILTLAASAVQAAEVRVYNWSDYIDESLLGKFEAETGIRVIYDVFESNETLEAKLLAGNSGYDVVVPSDGFVRRQIKACVFQELDQTKLSNAVHQWDLVQQHTAAFDPGNAYTINYLWGTTGVGVNVDKVAEVLGEDAPIDSLALVFDPANMEKLSTCGVYFLDAPGEMISAAMKYTGEVSDAQEAFDRAEITLSAVRPYVQKFDSSGYVTALANGDICVAMGWSGDVLSARDRAADAGNGVAIDYNAFREGSLVWFDQMAIPADAPNPDAAHAFLNFMLDPENIAAVSNYVHYANGNLSSQKYLDAEVIGNPAIYPDAETLGAMRVSQGWDAETVRRANRLWTKIKSGT